MLIFDIGQVFLLIMLEKGEIPYEEYAAEVPEPLRPKEYKTYIDFLKNRGKASKRIAKESEWEWRKFLYDNGLL